MSKNFPFTRGGSLDKNFFFQSEHVSSQIWCQKIFPLLGGDPTKNFFFQSEHVSSQIWCQKHFPLLRPDPPPPTQGWIRYPPAPPIQGSIRYPPSPAPHPRLDQVPPPRPRLDQVPPLPPSKAGSGTPPPPQVWIDTQSENITSRHPSDAGGNKLMPTKT